MKCVVIIDLEDIWLTCLILVSNVHLCRSAISLVNFEQRYSKMFNVFFYVVGHKKHVFQIIINSKSIFNIVRSFLYIEQHKNNSFIRFASIKTTCFTMKDAFSLCSTIWNTLFLTIWITLFNYLDYIV